jgi:hypothetical protein
MFRTSIGWLTRDIGVQVREMVGPACYATSLGSNPDIFQNYRHTAIFRHPFFRKQCFFLKYVLGTPLKIFGGMYKFGIYVCDNEVQFTILTVQGP